MFIKNFRSAVYTGNKIYKTINYIGKIVEFTI